MENGKTEKDGNLIVENHYPAIDGMRGIACLMVILFHSVLFSRAVFGDAGYEMYFSFMHLLQSGVDFFFVISGFLITGILMDTCNRKDALKTFYIRRSLRIFPLYYLILAVFAVYIVFTNIQKLSDIIPYIFYLQNYSMAFRFDEFQNLSHTWSLAIEEQFYILWPLIFLFCYRHSVKRAVLLCLLCLIISIVSRVVLKDIGHLKWVYTAVFAHMDGLVLGALGSILLKHYKETLVLLRPCLLWGALISIFLVILDYVFFEQTSILGFMHVFCISLFYLCVILISVTSDNVSTVNRMFSMKPFRFLGKISYGSYVVHAPVMIWFTYRLKEFNLGFVPTHLILFISGAVCTYVISYLLYQFYEKKFLILKDKYAPYN